MSTLKNHKKEKKNQINIIKITFGELTANASLPILFLQIGQTQSWWGKREGRGKRLKRDFSFS